MTDVPVAPLPLLIDAPDTGVRLAFADIVEVRRAAREGGWAAAYRAVARVLAVRRAEGLADADTPHWYALAAEINDPRSRHFAHFFTRAYLAAEVHRQTGLAIEPDGAAMQRCSNLIAERVLGPVLAGQSHRIGRFDEVGLIETRRLTRRLVPGLMLERTAWPAYAQLAWTAADRRFHGVLGRFLPFWRRGLPRWACPVEVFEDTRFLDELTPEERGHVRASAKVAAKRARACVKAGRWVKG